MVGSLLYVMTFRLDKPIELEFMLDKILPKKSHLGVINRIIIFVVGTYKLGLWYYTNIFVDNIFHTNVE